VNLDSSEAIGDMRVALRKWLSWGGPEGILATYNHGDKNPTPVGSRQ